MGKVTAVWCIEDLGGFRFRRLRRGIVVFGMGRLVEGNNFLRVLLSYPDFIEFVKNYGVLMEHYVEKVRP
jgi:hypothetical protein